MALMGRKIAAIRAYVVEGGGADYHDQSAEHWIVKQIATPMSIYPEYKATRTSFGINALKTLVVEVEADNGVTGFGITTGGYPAAWLVMNHLDRCCNDRSFGEIFGVTLSTKEDVILYAKKLQEMGAANVLVSMAGDGAVLVAEDGSTYKSEAPEGKVKNSVGAGDSMVAGFLYGYLKSGAYEDAFYYGVCTGSASAFSENLATREEVDTLLRNIKNRA